MRSVKSVDCDLCNEKQARLVHKMALQIIELEDKLAYAEQVRIEAENRYGELVETVATRTDQAKGK